MKAKPIPKLDEGYLSGFWEKVEKTNDCWLWTASKNKGGYGKYGISRGMYQAHRVSWTIHNGDIPSDLVIDHLCRVRHCVNPSHLEPVTNAVNIRRGDTGSWGRARTHCPHGHEYNEENTRKIVRPTGITVRMCKECGRVKSLEHARRSRKALSKFKKEG